MYAGEPSAMPSCVSDVFPLAAEALRALAIPKSVTIVLPPDSSTLSGLMSRCTMPCSWA